ncbi:hypothetical protein [Mesorhizobium sp.]|uniref:hypothetical protein n=1 Tax=Mesorhizobium sp. TaxID=1871066 RepID=UPI00120CAF7B|nr:hypothetical protein [Mesorhizobium sp.]TIP11313.1 MAG: hypothetical protein E5X73_16990 [Mesorhizobium sp.]
MKNIEEWVVLPTTWIEEGRLKKFQWDTHGSDGTAALMVLIVIAQHADHDGVARMTYDDIQAATGLSRTKIANGLGILTSGKRRLLELQGQSTYALTNYAREEGGWAKLPAGRMYQKNNVPAFHAFHLRSEKELVALKLYLTFVARRDNRTNMAHITYDQIVEYAGIVRGAIKPGITLLVMHGLVHVEQFKSSVSERGTANAYRFPHLNPYQHMGTNGRWLSEYQL